MGNSSGPDADVYGDPEAVSQSEPVVNDDEPADGAGGAAPDADDGSDQPPRRDARSGGAAGDPGGRKPDSIPTYRYEALEQRIDGLTRSYETRVRQLEEENRRFRVALGTGERPAAPRTYNPREQRIRSQIFNLMPELALLSDAKLLKLLERAPDLDRMAAEYPQASQAETRRWGGHAERMVRQVLNHAAVQWLGQGKTLKDLDPDDRDELDAAFVRWVGRRARAEEAELPDGYYGETTLRYEAGDPALVTEFWTHFTRRHAGGAGVQGDRRAAGAAAAARAAAARGTPRGGSSSPAVGSPGRQIQTPTLEQALDEGWSYVKQQQAGA